MLNHRRRTSRALARAAFFAAPALFALTPSLAAAQNMRDVPLGGRTATMGGAGTAFGNDSAMPYLNPAGLAGLPLDVFALSANIYASSKRTIPGVIHPKGFGFANQPGSESVSSSDLFQLPGSVMYLFNFNAPTDKVRIVAAMSLIIPSIEQSQTTGNYAVKLPNIAGGLSEAVSVSSSSTDYYIGPSFAAQLGKRIRVGMSLYALHTVSRLSYQRSLFYFESNGAATAEAKDLYTETHDGYSFVPIAGVQVNPFSHLWLGAGVAAPSVRMKGVRNISYDFQYQSVGGGYHATAVQSSDSQSERPLRVNVGVGWDKPGSFAVAGDIHWYAKRVDAIGYQGVANFTEQKTGDILRQYGKATRDTTDLKSILNISVGAEVWVLDMASVRGGVFTNFANATFDDNPTTAKPLSSTRDRYGATLGIGVLMGSFDSTIGGLYQRGKGQMVVSDYTSGAAIDVQGKNAITDFTENTFMFIFSGVVTAQDAKKNMGPQLDVDVKVKAPAMPETPKPPDTPAVPDSPSAPPAATPPGGGS